MKSSEFIFSLLIFHLSLILINSQSFIITINNPTNPHTIIAGDSIPVTWSYAPDIPGLDVYASLNCTSNEGNGYVKSETVITQSVDLQTTTQMYGSVCILEVVPAGISPYVTEFPVNVTVQQPLSFTLPVSNNTYYFADTTIPVELVTPNTSINEIVNTTLSCSGVYIDSFDLTTNSLTNYNIPPNANGYCTLTANPSASQEYLASNSTSFFLQYLSSLSVYTVPAIPGEPFNFTLGSFPVTFGQSATVNLYCGPSNTLAQTFNNVIIGVLYESTLDLTVPFGSCILKYAGSDSYSAVELEIQVSGLIEITAPESDSSVASNSTIDVTWIAKPPPTQFTTFNVTLDCKSSGAVSEIVTGESTGQLTIPETFYGDKCDFSVESTDYVTDTETLIVTQVLYIGIPANNTIVQQNTSYIYMELMTSGKNILYQPIYTSLTCTYGDPQTITFTTNTQQPAFTAGGGGNCTITINDPYPSYLVVPDPTVYFTIQYVLGYAFMPIVLYPDQLFVIGIATWTQPAPYNLPAVNLTLVCPGYAEPVASWYNIPMGIYTPLTFPIGTPLNITCNFETVETSLYAASVSDPVPVSKIPVTISKPLPSPPSYIQPNQLDLFVKTFIYPAPEIIGTVHLNLTCPNLLEPQPISVEINKESSFTPYPSVYGNCTLEVGPNDPVFQGEYPVDLTISYELTISSYPKVIYLNQTIVIQVDVISSAPGDLTANLTLNCDSGAYTYTWYGIGLNYMQELLAPLDAPESSTCNLAIQDSPDFVSTPVQVSVAKLQLEFFEPTTFTYNQPDITIPILISTNVIPNPAGNLPLNIYCPGYTDELQININEQIDFKVPETVTGMCTFNTSSTVYNLNEITVAIYTVISLELAPSTIYVNQTFNIVIAATGKPDTVTTLQLFCSNVNVTQWVDQPVNKPLTLIVPIDVAPDNNCYFITAPEDYQIPGVPVSVVVSNVYLEFSQPTATSFDQNDQIPIEVIAVGFPYLLFEVNVTWSCDCGYSENITMITHEPKSFSIPKSVYGPCTLSIDPSPLGFNSPQIVYFAVYWSLSMSDYPSTLYPTQYFPVLIEPALPSELANTTSVTLSCMSLVLQTWFNVSFNEEVQLQVDENMPAPSSNCFLQTNTNSPYVLEATSNPVSIDKIAMTIESPDGTVVVPNLVNLLVTTSLNTSISYTGGGLMSCVSNTKSVTYTTNQIVGNDYDDNFYGPCTIILLDVPSYFAVPDPVNFFIKYQLKFKNAIEVIRIGKPFVIEVLSSGKVPDSLKNITVNLVCSGKVVQSWTPVPLNEKTSLTLDKKVRPSNSCALVTEAPTVYFLQAKSTVVFGGVPFGGELFYISPEQQSQFAQSVSAPPSTRWNDLTFST